MYHTKELKSQEQLNELLLYKRIVEWDKDKLVLDDGLVVALECTDAGCDCVRSYGEFKNVTLDAVITDVKVGEEEEVPDDGTWIGDDTKVIKNTITIYHNQNEIALAELTTDAGNWAYYYSVGSMVIGDCYYPFVEA